jgi:Tol biopolymer transport system component
MLKPYPRLTITLLNAAILVLATIFVPLESAAQTDYGKNKVQYRYLRWEYLTTEHFNIYYSQDGREIADFVADIAEDVYRQLSQKFHYSEEGRDPITIITFKSHNEFQQTNVSSEEPDEATGGFTEFLKTRVVVPFEGDYEKLRHVVNHELTHAIMVRMLYGEGLLAITSGISQSRTPLWFTEGLAEYESRRGLDPETEMILRDAVVNDILPEISELDQFGYVGVYKCGQSVLYYIAQRYGDEKVGEMLLHMKGSVDFERALRASIGTDLKELSKRWRQFIKERYWPLVAKMDPPDRTARQLTNHKKEYCFINNSPALSPNGEWLAFLSDRSDYFDVYLMNTADGSVKRRLVRGQRSGKFEELHWLRPGITWSPDGTRIAFCARAAGCDVLYLINVETGQIERSWTPKADGLYSPAWSPDGSQIGLVRMLNGYSDIIAVDVASGETQSVTNDIWDDADPSWAPDSRRLLFTSNRGDNLSPTSPAPGQTLFGQPFEEFDIYEIELASGDIHRLTSDKFEERTPLWTSMDSTILYVSDRSGVFNIYLHNLATGESRPITNVVTGTFQPTLALHDGSLAFTSYFDYGYDVYAINNPFNTGQTVTLTEAPPAERIPYPPQEGNLVDVAGQDYQHFIFDRLLTKEYEPQHTTEDSIQAASRTRNESGRYPSYEYEVKLSPDLVIVNASYSPYFQMQGAGLMLLTDVLGSHQLYVSLYLNRTLEYSNTFLMYEYLARRIDYGVGFYHYAYPFSDNRADYIDRNWGVFLQTAYPLNRYNRVELSGEYMVVERKVWNDYVGYATGDRLETVVPHLGLVHDTSVWGYATAPTNGDRWRVDASLSPKLHTQSTGMPDRGYDFATFSVDWRRYFVRHKEYTFAFRLSGALSNGNNPQRFFLGGLNNWFNYRFDNPEGGVQIDINDVYYSSFVTPLRGVGYYNRVGTRYLLGNFEFRHPFIKQLQLGWPLPIYLRNVQGALFWDYGSAWSPDNPRLYRRTLLPKLWSHGYGFGIRLDLGIAPVEWDVAWSPQSGLRPQYYFSLNLGF